MAWWSQFQKHGSIQTTKSIWIYQDHKLKTIQKCMQFQLQEENNIWQSSVAFQRRRPVSATRYKMSARVAKILFFQKKTTHQIFQKCFFGFLKTFFLFFFLLKHKNPNLNCFYYIMQYHYFQSNMLYLLWHSKLRTKNVPWILVFA